MAGPIRIWGTNCTERRVEHGILLEFERVASTMDAARERLRAGETGLAGIRTDYQSAGRGRQGAVWLAPPGACLLVTHILPGSDDPDFSRNLAFAAGVAVAEAVEAVAEVSPRLKWPNDVLLSNRKLAGILIESVQRPNAPTPQRPNFLVGIGLNVNVERFPAELSETATSLEMETGLLYDLCELEEAVRAGLFALAGAPWEHILAKWRARDATKGRTYRAPSAGEGIIGVAAGITDEGFLRLETGKGIVDVLSATSKV